MLRRNLRRLQMRPRFRGGRAPRFRAVKETARDGDHSLPEPGEGRGRGDRDRFVRIGTDQCQNSMRIIIGR